MKKFMRGETHYVRYADDFLLTFQYEEDAITVMRWLKVRLAKFGLEVAEDKTRILPFGKYRGTKESFDFFWLYLHQCQNPQGMVSPRDYLKPEKTEGEAGSV